MYQKTRKTFLLISFLLFPITIFYFSPYLIIQGTMQGIIVGSFIVFTLLFFLSLLFGRAFCGWLCPVGSLQEICFRINDNKAKGGKFNIIKYIIWVPWIATIIIMAIFAGGYHSTDIFYQTTYGISLLTLIAYIFYYGVIGIIIILSLTKGKRAFCHYGCWMAPFMIIGTKIKNKFKWPSYHLEVEPEKCNQCKSCDNVCPMSLNVYEMVQCGSMANTECILCGSCVEACPQNVITTAWKWNK